MALYDEIVLDMDIRRIYLYVNKLQPAEKPRQLSLFDAGPSKINQASDAILEIQRRYGKNAIFRGEDLEKHATTLVRNSQIGGHSANSKSYKSAMTGGGDE